MGAGGGQLSGVLYSGSEGRTEVPGGGRPSGLSSPLLALGAVNGVLEVSSVKPGGALIGPPVVTVRRCSGRGRFQFSVVPSGYETSSLVKSQ